ncbi:MAG: right-handed parallel beta-helix repeat-containing protein [Planctomycetota bacterium]|jgi:hypothetical protein
MISASRLCVRPLFVLFAALLFVPAGCARLPWERGSYYPSWRGSPSRRVITFQRDATASDEENGARLAEAIQGLKAGDELRIGPGKYSVNKWFDVVLKGTARAPIRIVAADPERRPVITRPDTRQNVVNIGIKGRSEHLLLRGLEITGGSTVLKIYRGENIWVDGCLLHTGVGVGLAALSNDTRFLYITRNEIRDIGIGGGTGEGMYLGNHGGKWGMSYSTVALNHVHRTAGSQGDGIEVKPNSYNNWIVANTVHDTQCPGIIAYGTGGRGINLIERNVVYRSRDALIQIQGDAVVRNNLLFNAPQGLHSKDHVGKTRNLRIVHNTILNARTGCELRSWNGREGLVFANNAVYSRDAEAVLFSGGSAGVIFKGNVVRGTVEGIEGGYVKGRGLEDFAGVSWDGAKRDARPASGSALVGGGDPEFTVERDMKGRARPERPTAGALEP